MTVLKKIFHERDNPTESNKNCYNCDNYYAEYIIYPDFTTLRGSKVPQMSCRDYCTIHNVSLPSTINEAELPVVNVANCKQWEQLKKK